MKKGYPTHESRTVTDLKHLVKSAAEIHGDNVYLRYKGEEKDQIIDVTFNDIDKYIEYKSPCIEEVYKMCGLK